MGEVHKLLDEKGRVGVLADPCNPFDRAVVEAASSYLTCEPGEIGYLYSGWAQSALPHKRLADNANWQVDRLCLASRRARQAAYADRRPNPRRSALRVARPSYHPLSPERSDADQQPGD